MVPVHGVKAFVWEGLLIVNGANDSRHPKHPYAGELRIR